MRLPDGELLPQKGLLTSVTKLMCKSKATKKLCASVYLLLSGHKSKHTNKVSLIVLFIKPFFFEQYYFSHHCEIMFNNV